MPAGKSSKLISFVLPVYNESANLELMYERLSAAITKLKTYDAELIFVNDGSQDDSIDVLLALAKRDPRIIIVDFSRNFGHQLAITAGLDYSSGDAVITMDSDLQDPPEVCARLLGQWEKGYYVVYAKRRSRKGESLFKRASAHLFYMLINKLSETNIPANVGDFRLLDRKVVDELGKFREHNRFMRGLVSYVGFKQATVIFDRPGRQRGKTGYPLRKMLALALDGITGFSTAPIRLISRVGYLVSFLSLAGIAYTVGVKVFAPSRAVPGWAFVTVSIFLIGGIQFIMLGLLGNYIARVYTEAQSRPLYVVAAVHGKTNKKING